MSLYDIIYEFFYDNIFTNTTLASITAGSLTLNMNEWLCHTCTLILLGLGVFVLCYVVRWIFRVFAGLIRI